MPQQIGEGRRRCRGKKEGETRSIGQAQRAQTQGGFQKVSPESASADFLVLTCFDSHHKNQVNHSLASTRAALHSDPARAACPPLPLLLPPRLMIELIHPRRDTHDPLARRMYHTVDQNRKQDPGPPRRRLSSFLSSSLLLHPALYSRQARSEDSSTGEGLLRPPREA